MDNFQKKFVEEALDLINTLESALLELEESPENKVQVAEVFRVMHSLKGGGAMFGFDKVSELTHDLENIYDMVRNNKLQVTHRLLNLTLEAVDHLKLLLSTDTVHDAKLQTVHSNLVDKIKKFAQNPLQTNDVEPVQPVSIVTDHSYNTYHLLFRPSPEMFNDGSNPLYLIDELHNMGKCMVFANTEQIPDVDTFDITKCYTSWDVFVETQRTDNELHDVFIFVADQAEITVTHIANGNWLDHSLFVEEVQRMYKSKQFYISQLQVLVKSWQQQNQLQQNHTEISDYKRIEIKDNVISSVRVSADKLDKLMNLVSELVTTQAGLSLFVEDKKIAGLGPLSESIEGITRQLRDIAFSMSLIPVEQILTRFHRLVRDLSVEFDKEIDFVTEGAETELDKVLIQGLTEPIMHILRNSIDHGIESPAERVEKGKPRRGRILFRAFYSGAAVHIQLKDDGRGINPDKIRQKAIEKGFVEASAVLSERDLLNLIFLPGFSTAQKVTDVSGRGVGMDVVKRKINEIRGEVELDSHVDVGTTITIKLPLTLSIIDGLLVSIKPTNFVIPLSMVDKIYAVERKTIETTFNKVLVLEGEQIPFFDLTTEFELSQHIPEIQQVVVVHYEQERIGLVVNHVVGEYQAVLKPLGRHYKDQEMISAATILGDGTIALVLDTNKIIKDFFSKRSY